MNTNGLSLYNVGTSLDLDALNQGAPTNNNDDGDESDDGDEEEFLQRNAELQDLLKNGFDDLIDDESEDDSVTSLGDSYHPRQESVNNKYGYTGETDHFQHNNVASPALDNKGLLRTNNGQSSGHNKHSVRFGPERNTTHAYEREWNPHNDSENENHYLSSGNNPKTDLEIICGARTSEIERLSAELRKKEHKIALLEAEKTGMRLTMETSERMLQDTKEENQRLNSEMERLKKQVHELIETNRDTTAKLLAAESNAVNLERQIIDINVMQASQRDANRQEVLLNSIKMRYENDLRTLRDELELLRSELDRKNEKVMNLESKLRDVTEMHERTLSERAANLQEFNRALDQQRLLREQRESLTNATLLEQLSKAQEEIERLKCERISMLTLSDSMSQLSLGNKRDQREAKQTERIISSLEQRLENSEKENAQLREALEKVTNERDALLAKFKTINDSASSENSKLVNELANVKELYLSICREKDSIEEELKRVSTAFSEVENERKRLLKELEDANAQMDESLNRHKATIEANMDAKIQSIIQESVARERLEWLKEKTQGHTDDLAQVEKSLHELQGLRDAMDSLRHERDMLQEELIKRQQQLKVERHLLREKFAVEKDMLVKIWQEKLAAATSAQKPVAEPNPIINVTADAMARMRQQCEDEKLAIIASYERQILELQSNISSPVPGQSFKRTNGNKDWKLDLLKVKMNLRNIPHVPPELVNILEASVEKAEASNLRDQKTIQDLEEKYKHLKRRVRDYQKYVNEKMAKYKADRQQSEEYCRNVISELLKKVTQELSLLENDRQNANSINRQSTERLPPTSAFAAPRQQDSCFTQSIEVLQKQVNQYVADLAAFTQNPK